MVSFKSWKDFYRFLQKYHNFSCLQCQHYKNDIDLDAENTDFRYAHFFCPKTVSIVDFRFQVACPEWTDKKGKQLKDYADDTPVYNFEERFVDELDSMDDVTIEDIDRMVEQ